VTQELDTEHLLVFAEKAAVEHGMADATITLLNVSENATYRLDSSDGRRIVLRVHRTGYHSQEAIHSELTWVRSLRDEGIVSTARVVLTPDGREVVAVTHPGGEQRFVVAFEWMNGVHPPEDRLVDDFVQLGAITARLHGHAKAWRPPAGLPRVAPRLAALVAPPHERELPDHERHDGGDQQPKPQRERERPEEELERRVGCVLEDEDEQQHEQDAAADQRTVAPAGSLW